MKTSLLGHPLKNTNKYELKELKTLREMLLSQDVAVIPLVEFVG